MIKLNKLARICYRIALRRKKITEHSSPKGVTLGISSEWRELYEASTARPSEHVKEWSEFEEEAADIIIATMSALEHVKCRNIEQLLRDKIDFNKRRAD